LAGDHVLRIDAILNATSNVVLSKMESTGCALDEAIAEACALGIAESDPATDLDGVDAAAKLAILCALGFGMRVVPSDIDTRTTARVGAREFGVARLRAGTIRQIAHAAFDSERRVLEAWVAPTIVPQESLFGRASGPWNAAVITCAYAGEIAMSGQGAGADVIAAAIVGDLLAIARDRAAIVPAPKLAAPAAITGFCDSSLAEAV
jgi:homoserine dehydrogenase